MPGIFENFGRSNMPLPSQQQAAMIAAQQQQFVSQNSQPNPYNPLATMGAGIGQAFGQRREARQAEERANIFNSALEAALENNDGNLQLAEIEAYVRAAGQLNAAGNKAAAQEMYQAALEAEERRRMFDLNAGKLEADIEATRTGAVESTLTETIRLQMRRDQLQTAMDTLDMNSPAAARVAEQIDELNAEIDKRGTITGTTEHDPGAKLTSGTIQDIQNSIRDNQATLDSLQVVSETFDPSYYTLSGRVEGAYLRLQDIAGLPLSADDKAELVQRTQNLRAMTEQLNSYIDAVTGATVGQGQETVRLKSAVPQPGDSPTVIAEKMAQLQWMLPAINARNMAILNSGDLSLVSTPLEEYRVRQVDEDDFVGRYLQEAAQAVGAQ